MGLAAGLLLAVLATAARGQVVGADSQLSTPPPSWTNNANEPSIATSGQTVLAAWQWLRGACSKNVGWALSRNGGSSWTLGGVLSPSEPVLPSLAGQPAICTDPAGVFHLISKTCESDGSRTVVAYRGTVNSVGISWQGPTTAVVVPYDPTSGPDYLDRLSVACDPSAVYLYVSFAREQTPYDAGSRTYSFVSTIQFVRSLDGGATWSSPFPISSTSSRGSRVVVGPDRELYVFWQDFGSGQALGRKSTDFGQTFGAPFVVGAMLDNVNTPPPNWTSEHSLTGPDYPAVAIDRSTGPRRGALYAAWTDVAVGAVDAVTQTLGESEPNDYFGQATPMPFNATVFGSVASSDLGGTDENDIFSFEGEQGTTVQITLNHSLFPQPAFDEGHPLNLYGESTPGTVVGITGGTVYMSGLSAPLIFTLPRTGRYYVIACSGGQYTCLYSLTVQVLRPAASSTARDHRDIVITSSSDGGMTWTPKRRVADAPPWFDECMPEVAVDERGLVHVAWYGRQDDPVLGRLANTYWTVSGDGGFSFVPTRRLSTASSYWGVSGGGDTAGDHLALTTTSDAAQVLWMDQRIGHFRIFGARITDLPTSIAVPRFMVAAAGSSARLTWTVAVATGISGFHVYRAEGTDGAFVALDGGEVAVQGVGEYAYDDASVLPGRTYRYKLEVLRGASASDWEGPRELTMPSPITRLALERLGPNPFDREVRFELLSPRAAEARVEVLDVAGHAVATVHAGSVPAGTSQLAWDGRGRDGAPVAPGVYLLRAAVGADRATKRLIRVR